MRKKEERIEQKPDKISPRHYPGIKLNPQNRMLRFLGDFLAYKYSIFQSKFCYHLGKTPVCQSTRLCKAVQKFQEIHT